MNNFFDLQQENVRLKEKICQLQQDIRRLCLEQLSLKALVQDLQEGLSLSSKNSSQPPSSDYKKNSSAPLPKKRGSKKGHKGTCRSLYPQEEVDHFVSCTSTTCPYCGSEEITEKGALPRIHQQVEVERGGVVVTQYERVRYVCCGCSRRFSGELPQGVTTSAFGVKLSSIITLLTGKYHLSKRETKSAVKDLYEVDISLGAIVGIEKKMSQALESLYDEIRQDVRGSDGPVYVDETGWRESGQGYNVWVASTIHSCTYMVAKHRNRETYYRFLGDDLLKPLVSDRYSVYHCITRAHQYCLAHIFRDFIRVSERKGVDGVIGMSLRKHLKAIFEHWHSYKQGEVNFFQMKNRCGYHRGKIKEWLEEGSIFGNQKTSSFCNSIIDSFKKLWTFLSIRGVEPTNNEAERSLRSIVLWRKKSFGTRSESGQRFVERIMSVIKTGQKRSWNVLRVLCERYSCCWG